MASLIFYVNGKRIEETSFSVEQNLASYLRGSLRLIGCKIGCGQGVCGSCTVVLSYREKNSIHHKAVNACLLPLPACHMKAITTVEGLGSARKSLHPLQESLAKNHAVQCGFCTPGFVMSAYALLRNRGGMSSPEELDRALRGNLCRCTGYRPILQAVQGICCGKGCCKNETSGKEIENSNREPNGESSNIDKTQELIFPPELITSSKDASHVLEGGKGRWSEPSDWAKAETELRKHPDSLIVGGNTLQAVRGAVDGQKNVMSLRNINEFHHDGDKVVIGAGMTLEVLESHIRSSSDIKNPFYNALLKILDNHTSSQVKCMATVGGSISAYRRYPFLSVLLSSLDAKLNAFDRRSSKSVTVSLAQRDLNELSYFVIYRVEISMKSVEKLGFFILFDKPQRWCLSAVKRQGASCSATLSFTVPGEVEGCYKINTFQGSFPILFCATDRTDVGKDASSLYSSWIDLFQRNLGQHKAIENQHQFQKFPAVLTSDSIVGTPAVTTMAFEATTGEATFLDDISSTRDEVQLALVSSPHPHAKIVSIDASEALEIPGVVAFISAKDSPCNQFSVLVPPADEEVFAQSEVTFIGQPVGAVAAESRELALKAAKLVRVQYEPLPAVTTMRDAEEQHLYLRSAFCPSHESSVERGDITRASTVSGELEIEGQEHFYLEPQSALAIPSLDDTIIVYSSSHGPTNDQNIIAQVLQLPTHNVEVRTKRLGGSFGGKEVRGVIASVPTAVAAYKLRRPVRCIFTRDLDMRISGGRHPLYAKYDISIENGKIDKICYDAVVDGGATIDVSTVVRDNIIMKCQSGYGVPNLRYRSRACKTNRASNTAFRGFGGPQGMMILEMAIEHAAQHLGLCPDEVREKSIVRTGDKDYMGNAIIDDNLHRCFTTCKDKAEYARRTEEIKTFNRENEDKKRGIAIIPTRYGIGYNVAFLNQGSALVNIYSSDGSIILHHAGVEIGQGIDIKMQQVGAQVLGLPLTLFRTYPYSTNILPNVSPSAGSSTADLIGPAVIDACKTLSSRLKWSIMDGESVEERVKRWKGTVFNAYMSKVDLSARGFFAHPNEDFGPSKSGDFFYYTYGAACSEVELNCRTGEYRVLRADIVMDVGKSLNPAVDIGQIEGGYMQGFGLFCKERLKFSQNDGLPKHVVQDYTIPTISDVPPQFNVHLLTESENKTEHAVYSSKGIGEPPFFLGSSVYFAMRRALHAINEKSRHFIRIDCPATSDRIRKAIAEMKQVKDHK